MFGLPSGNCELEVHCRVPLLPEGGFGALLGPAAITVLPCPAKETSGEAPSHLWCAPRLEKWCKALGNVSLCSPCKVSRGRWQSPLHCALCV